VELYRLNKTHIPAASKALAEAFLEDGLVLRICPEEENRERAIEPVFRFSASTAVRSGEAWATSPDLEGVALWQYSWRMFFPPWSWFTFGGFDIYRNLSRKGYRELMRVSDRIDRARASVAPDRYLYLSSLGVRPEFRRKGLATALVADRIRAAEKDGVPTIVETNTPEALAFYESVGFRSLKTFRAADMDYYVLVYGGSF
jgi:ribosomal protein S18 acetylase RimI-like enzyme